MPKYDAFGREIGEDTLGGWRTSEPEPGETARLEPEAAPAATPPPPAEPVFTAAPPQPQPPVARPPQPQPPVARPPAGRDDWPVRRRRRRRSPIIMLLILGGIILGVGNFISGVTGDVADSVGPIVDVPRIRVPDLPDVPDVQKPPVGLRGESLIRPAALREAISDLEGRRLGNKTWTFRLAPERIDATFVKRNGLHTVQLRFDGTFRKFGVSRGSVAHLTTVDISKLDPAAPQRLVRAAARRIGKPTTKIDYLVPQTDGWIAYFKGGQYFQGDRSGKLLRRIS